MIRFSPTKKKLLNDAQYFFNNSGFIKDLVNKLDFKGTVQKKKRKERNKEIIDRDEMIVRWICGLLAGQIPKRIDLEREKKNTNKDIYGF